MKKDIKKDWSAIRMTVLLYIVVILIPFNYYFAKQSFDSMRNDASTMNHLVFVNGALQYLASTSKISEKISLIKKIDSTLDIIEQSFIKYPANAEYVALFRADESFNDLRLAYDTMKKVSNKPDLVMNLTYDTFKEVYVFSKTAEEMMNYKIKTILDKLYLSLVFTTISIITLIFLIRLYIKLQLLKHSIHDHVTGLYNKKYFKHVLEHTQTLAKRQEHPLSLLTLSITNYEELKTSLEKENFENYLKEFSTIFSHFFRQSDTVCRIEKDYFVSIMPDAPQESIAMLYNNLQQRLLHKLQSSNQHNNLTINVRIGVATDTDNSSSSLLEASKKNMESGDELSIGKMS